MKEFGYGVLIRRSVHMSVLLCVHQKRETSSPLLFLILLQGSTPPLTNSVTSPHCFGTAFTSDVTSQLNSREREGALDSKNPYYWSSCFRADTVPDEVVTIAFLTGPKISLFYLNLVTKLDKGRK